MSDHLSRSEHPATARQIAAGQVRVGRVDSTLDGAAYNEARPRELNEWLVCEEYGFRACEGECPIHHGDACLIVVAWVDNSHVRRERESLRNALWLARSALRDAQDHTDDERLSGVIRVTLDRVAEERV